MGDRERASYGKSNQEGVGVLCLAEISDKYS